MVGVTGALWFATRSALKVQAAQAQQPVEATPLLAIINGGPPTITAAVAVVDGNEAENRKATRENKK